MTHPEERVGPHFNQFLFLEARIKTIELTHMMASLIHPGMLESEAHLLLKEKLEIMGIEKLWHPSKIRFGPNTMKSFRDLSDETIRIEENDLFFLDLGPVINQHEGDFGQTFIFGKNPELEKILHASKKLFELTQDQWKKNGLTGRVLYDWAQMTAQSWGYELNLRMDGHRLSDFPHALIHKGDLGEFNQLPSSGLWVLEIHLLDHKSQRGAFYEDLLG